MQAYVARFHPSFVGFTGTSSRIAVIAKHLYIAVRQVGDGTVSHTSSIMLLDPEGRFTAVYGDEDLAALEADLRRLVRAGDT